jgi:hypothetical protein
MMAPCIYCGAAADSREHWFPRALGNIKDIVLLRDRLCDVCNKALGRELDEELARTGPTGFNRTALGIKGRRSHADVSPFHYRALSPQQPTTLKRPAPHGEWEILGDAYTTTDGRPSSRTLRQLVVKTTDGRIEPVPFPRAWNGAQLRETLQKRGLEGSELLEVYLEEGEKEDDLQIRQLLTDVFGVFHSRVWFGEQVDSKLEAVTLKAGITRNYLRAIAKVAFHYFVSVTTRCTGAEQEFGAIRSLIRQNQGEPRDFVELVTPYFIPEISEGYVPQQTSHFFLCDEDTNSVVVRIQFFVGPKSLYPPAAVYLGPNPHSMGARLLSCHQISYYASRTDGYDGEITKIQVMERPIEPG